MSPHRPRHLDTWSPVGGTVLESVLLELASLPEGNKKEAICRAQEASEHLESGASVKEAECWRQVLRFLILRHGTLVRSKGDKKCIINSKQCLFQPGHNGKEKKTDAWRLET